MYVVGWLHFLTVEKRPSIGNILCIPGVHFPLDTQGPGASWSQASVWLAFGWSWVLVLWWAGLYLGAYLDVAVSLGSL